MHSVFLAVAASVAFVFVSCTPQSGSDARQTLLNAWGEHVILPEYAQFAILAAEMEPAIEAFCAEASPATLEQAQEAWTVARAPWKRMEVFSFGPYADEPLRLGPKIDTWPARTDAVDAFLAGDESITAEKVAGLGVYNRGFPALEYLLFAGDVAAAEGEARRCGYMLALAQDLGSLGAQMYAAWDPEQGAYLDQLLQAGKGSTVFLTVHDALGEVVNRIGHLAQEMRTDKLGRPLGESTDGTPQQQLVESRFSGRSVQDLKDNLAGIEQLVFPEESGAMGLARYAATLGHEEVGVHLRAQIDVARVALEAIDEPLADAIVFDRGGVETAGDALEVLRQTLQTDVLSALSLSVSFNEADGD